MHLTIEKLLSLIINLALVSWVRQPFFNSQLMWPCAFACKFLVGITCLEFFYKNLQEIN